MKKGKVFFHPIEGSACLSISWSSGPKEDAIEAKRGNSVGFFTDSGELLGVIFDEVLEDQDHQILEFAQILVEVTVKCAKVIYKVSENKPKRTIATKKRASSRRLQRNN